MAEPLFNPKTVRRLCKDITVTEEQEKAAHEWLKLLSMNKLKDERSNYLKFVNIILERILDYHPVNDIMYEENQSEFTLCNSEGHEMVCVEVKGSDVEDLTKRQYRKKQEHTTPIEQLWNYMGSRNMPYGICTNYIEFHLMRQPGFKQRHVFDIRRLASDMSGLREFVGMFSRKRLEAGFVDKVRDASEREERDITDEFYALYGNTRLMLIREFEEDGAERRHAVSYAQTFLNRIIFTLFAEAHELIERRHVSLLADIMSVLDGPIGGRTKKLWRHITEDLFDWLDRGSDDPRVFGFNGGLFRNAIPLAVHFPDKRSNSLFEGIEYDRPTLSHEQQRFLDRHRGINPLIINMMAMASYDFLSDIRVTILGHIFEHSIQEIDELLGGGSLRRKREGVFYTPEYITRYICRNTIIPYLSKSGRATKTEDLVSEYENDIGALEKQLAAIRILDPACGSGAFLIEATRVLLEIHRTVWERKV